MSNFTFFHNFFNIICILKSFNSHISVVICSFYEFETVSKWCIREWVNHIYTYLFLPFEVATRCLGECSCRFFKLTSAPKTTKVLVKSTLSCCRKEKQEFRIQCFKLLKVLSNDKILGFPKRKHLQMTLK